jgi:hypothetical protein
MELKTALALKSLAAADLASLCDAIQTLYETNLAIAKQTTIQQGKALLLKQTEALPKFLDLDLGDDDLETLVCEMLP